MLKMLKKIISSRSRQVRYCNLLEMKKKKQNKYKYTYKSMIQEFINKTVTVIYYDSSVVNLN